jgi:hypothetical protein
LRGSAALGHLYGSVGKTTEAQTIFDELIARSDRGFVPSYDIALVCTGLGWIDRTFAYLSQALKERSGWMTYINIDPRLDPLRTDAGFIDLVHRARLT